MSILRETPIRKTVSRGNISSNVETFENVIITDEYYKTNGELLIIVKDVSSCKIELDSTTTDKIKIKTLTNCTILPDIGRIDEDWDEISVGRGACVELQHIGGTWYILSSDGVKLD
jgi:hypothetical protein